METLFFHPENPEVEVIASLAFVLSVGPGHSKLPQLGLELPSHLNDSYSQRLYSICMTEIRLDSKALKPVQVAYLKNPSSWKEWHVL